MVTNELIFLFDNEPISTIKNEFLNSKYIQLDLLRLDLIHPEISGNKWFKLKYNLAFALENNFKSIVSFGGAFSNHLHALAFAGFQNNIKTIGIIRGEIVENYTLFDCQKWGMELHFIDRKTYREKYETNFLIEIQRQFPTSYIIQEGGNNDLGQKGCEEILGENLIGNYDLICCAVGTGATLTGIINSVKDETKVLGFCAIKNGEYLKNIILQQTNSTNWDLNYNYHFGGFAKMNIELKNFIEEFKIEHSIVLDRVYTSKMMFGIFDLIKKNIFKEHTKILAIHTGGLQGNRTLEL